MKNLPDHPCPKCGTTYFWSNSHYWSCWKCAPPDDEPLKTCTVPPND